MTRTVRSAKPERMAPALPARAALFLCMSSAAASTPRATVNFDFGWRFAPAQEQRYLAQCTFEENMNYGRGSIWGGWTASKEECCSECANRETCLSWDWNGRMCYVKDNAAGGKAEKGRWSGRLGASFTKNASFAWPNHQAVPSQAVASYDDAAWELVDAPHDFGRERMDNCLGGGRRQLANGGEDTPPPAITNNCSGWYRKHFSLPSEWEGGVTWLYFEGVYHNSAMWLNGKPLGAHENGYTSFWHRIDTAGAKFGDGTKNVLAIYANGNPADGFWYGGAGLTRHQYLVHTLQTAYLPPDRSWVHASGIGKITANGFPGHGQTGTATLVAAGMLSNGAAVGGKVLSNVWVTARFTAAVGSTAAIASASAGPFSIAAGATENFAISTIPAQPMQLWSVARPFLYTAQLQVSEWPATARSTALIPTAIGSQLHCLGARRWGGLARDRRAQSELWGSRHPPRRQHRDEAERLGGEDARLLRSLLIRRGGQCRT